MRWKSVIGVVSLALVLFAAALTPASAAMSVRGQMSENAATASRTMRGSAPAPVIGEAVMETPDPNLPLGADRPAPVIGEAVMETPDPSRPEDVNSTSRSIRR